MDFIDFYTSIYFGYFNVAFLVLLTLGTLYLARYIKWNTYQARAAILIFVFLTVTFLLEGAIIDSYFTSKLNSFDLDGDGFFSIEESTSEKERYSSIVMGDAGRYLIPILILVFTAIYSLLIYFIIRAYRLIISRIRKK